MMQIFYMYPKGWFSLHNAEEYIHNLTICMEFIVEYMHHKSDEFDVKGQRKRSLQVRHIPFIVIFG